MWVFLIIMLIILWCSRLYIIEMICLVFAEFLASVEVIKCILLKDPLFAEMDWLCSLFMPGLQGHTHVVVRCDH